MNATAFLKVGALLANLAIIDGGTLFAVGHGSGAALTTAVESLVRIRVAFFDALWPVTR